MGSVLDDIYRFCDTLFENDQIEIQLMYNDQPLAVGFEFPIEATDEEIFEALKADAKFKHIKLIKKQTKKKHGTDICIFRQFPCQHGGTYVS